MGLPLDADGAGGRIRTADLLITNQLLYQLSYASYIGSSVFLFPRALEVHL